MIMEGHTSFECVSTPDKEKRPSRAEKRRLKRAEYTERKKVEDAECKGLISVYTFFKNEIGCSGGCGHTRTAYVLHGSLFGGHKNQWEFQAIVGAGQDLVYDRVTNSDWACCSGFEFRRNFRVVDKTSCISTSPKDDYYGEKTITERITYTEMMSNVWIPRFPRFFQSR